MHCIVCVRHRVKVSEMPVLSEPVSFTLNQLCWQCEEGRLREPSCLGSRQLFSVFSLTPKLRSTCAPLLEPCTVYTDVENKRSTPWNESLQFQIISFHNRIALTGAVFLPQFYNISFLHLYIFCLYTYPHIFRFLSSNTFTTWVLLVNLHTVAHQGGQNWWIFNSCVSDIRRTKEKRGNL